MKTNKFIPFFLLLAILAGASSCIDDIFIEGNGIYRTESRAASGFEQVTSSGDFNVTIIPGTEYEVEISAESNLLPYIETDVAGNTLKIHTRGLYSLRNHHSIEILITTPILSGLNLSGSGKIKTGSFISGDDVFHIGISGSGDIDTDVSANKIKGNVSGSGTIFLRGDAYESEFVISGSGKIRAYDLVQEYCQATISGSGDMFVNVSDVLDARISGSGKVFYVNFPEIHTSISGSGSVVNKN